MFMLTSLCLNAWSSTGLRKAEGSSTGLRTTETHGHTRGLVRKPADAAAEDAADVMEVTHTTGNVVSSEADDGTWVAPTADSGEVTFFATVFAIHL